jgi:hypothetical protein
MEAFVNERPKVGWHHILRCVCGSGLRQDAGKHRFVSHKQQVWTVAWLSFSCHQKKVWGDLAKFLWNARFAALVFPNVKQIFC